MILKAAITISITLASLFLTLVSVTPSFAIDATTSTTTRREKMEKRIDGMKDKFEQRMEDKKENFQLRMENFREKIASKEANFKKRLESFKDKRKSEIVGRININLNKINQHITDRMLKHLEKMSSILDRLNTRVNEGSPDIKDPAAAKLAIASASAAIAGANEAVKNQAVIDYSITEASESSAKKEAQEKRQKLHDDLQAVRKLVIGAKQAVAHAIKLTKSGKDMEGTQSGQQ